MKFLLVVLVVVVGLWLMMGRSGRRGPLVQRDAAPPPPPQPAKVEPMRACAHCGMHVPGGEALLDAAERPYCSEAHRRAGPR